jgi:predicted nucleotidyltransferase
MEQIDRIVSLVRDVFGEDAVGAYLHGSAVLGGLRPDSDIDVLVVTRRATTPHEKRMLIDRLLALSGSGDPSGNARSIELTVVVSRTSARGGTRRASTSSTATGCARSSSEVNSPRGQRPTPIPLP